MPTGTLSFFRRIQGSISGKEETLDGREKGGMGEQKEDKIKDDTRLKLNHLWAGVGAYFV